MLRSSRILLIASLMVPAWTGLAAAATPVSRESGLHLYDGHSPLFPEGFPYQDDAVFTALTPYDNTISYNDGGTVQASQQSSVSAAGASAVLQSLAANSSWSQGYYSAKNQFTYTFDVVAPENYSLTGLLTITTLIPPTYRPEYGVISLTGPGAAINVHTDVNSTPFSYSGTLTPGTYTLYLETYSQDSANVGGTVDLSANLVLAPEPSALLALAGVPLLALRQGRRR